jgi:plastocyanin
MTRTRTAGTIFLLIAAIAIAVLSTGGAWSAPKVTGHGIAIPGSSIAGYVPRQIIITQGSNAQFHNLDIAPHDVRSSDGLFASAIVGVGKTTLINGTSLLAKGSYRFFCSVHPSTMKGTLSVR